MEVIQFLEDFGDPGDAIEFQCTRVIYLQDGQIYQGFSKNRYFTKTDIKISDLYNTSLIPTEAFYPIFEEDSFTRADPSKNAIANWYIKQPRLSNYSPDYPDLVKYQVLEEVKICERLRKHPLHPNIARYHGCKVEQGRITGLCFTKYGQTLIERVNPGKQSKRMFSSEADRRVSTEVMNHWMDGIERGIRHLHSLGIVHNDINPANIIFDNSDTPVIIDFDSCRPEGCDLSMVRRTFEWTDESVKEAMPENDFNALREIRMWLAGDTDGFKF